MAKALILLPLTLALASCRGEPPFTPGVEGRAAKEICNSTSSECQKWTELARKCAENMRKRDEGYMGRLEPYCDQMETYREQVSGVAASSDPGAYSF